MEKKPIEINQSSLLSLKAEILKKQQEVQEAKLKARSLPTSTVKRKTASTSTLIRNPGIEERNARDEFNNEIDSDVLKQSRIALEAKSKLYEKLSQTVISEEHEGLYLVQFNKKPQQQDSDQGQPSWNESNQLKSIEDDQNYEDPTNIEAGDEWVEYTDCLGRSRMCLRKDLPFVKSKDKKLSTFLPPEKQQPIPVTEMDEFNERREQMRQQWEAQERDLMNKDNIHYQDVLFDEARSHGVGYFNFSHNEDERIKQQEELKNLRQETKNKQQQIQELKQKRDAEKAARVRAAKNRQRARAGLPPLEDEPEPKLEPIIIDQPPEEKTDEDKAKEKELEIIRNQHIRPWDIGKKDRQREPKSQEEWVQEKRKERPKEFAPPSAYDHNSRRRKTSSSSSDDENRTDQRETSKNYYQRFYEHPLSPSVPEDEKNPLRFTTKKTSKTKWKDFYPDEVEEQPVNPYKRVYNPFTSDFVPIPIVNEVEESNSVLYDPFEEEHAEDDVERNQQLNNYAEIPPPPTMEYYGTDSKASSSRAHQNKKPLGEIQASIEAGLKFLRKQSERKHAKTENVGFFD
ncbi:coiled-coil domain-containing protein 174 [Chrysoperla carnea]|uniref:coiled-coil domain-containing protein 174 n=1 Tax=Chrysoperla carnea TaxID=189513 RepID=UPI001D07F041|nr:coiled-coil domain-containing protein 174 [Chrysoperla carnea]